MSTREVQIVELLSLIELAEKAATARLKQRDFEFKTKLLEESNKPSWFKRLFKIKPNTMEDVEVFIKKDYRVHWAMICNHRAAEAALETYGRLKVLCTDAFTSKMVRLTNDDLMRVNRYLPEDMRK